MPGKESVTLVPQHIECRKWRFSFESCIEIWLVSMENLYVFAFRFVGKKSPQGAA